MRKRAMGKLPAPGELLRDSQLTVTVPRMLG